jgi:hypothetical protein
MTVSERNERYMNGSSMPPIFCVIFCRAWSRSTTSSYGSVDINPQQSSGRAAVPLPLTAAMPPPMPMTSAMAFMMASSLVPQATRLWASWAILAAIAPLRNPNPCTSPTPRAPVP